MNQVTTSTPSFREFEEKESRFVDSRRNENVEKEEKVCNLKWLHKNFDMTSSTLEHVNFQIFERETLIISFLTGFEPFNDLTPIFVLHILVKAAIVAH